MAVETVVKEQADLSNTGPVKTRMGRPPIDDPLKAIRWVAENLHKPNNEVDGASAPSETARNLLQTMAVHPASRMEFWKMWMECWAKPYVNPNAKRSDA